MNASHFKDYYQILGVDKEATPQEIKKAYRKLAFEFHPDRNPGQREHAETRFKEITEAYGILMDADKRREYDSLRSHGRDYTFAQAGQQGRAGGSTGSPFEDIIRDLFNNPEASRVFRDMHREFGKRGMRFDQNFLNNLLFGRKGFFVGGVFFYGPGGRRSARTFGSPNVGFERKRAFQGFSQTGLKTKKDGLFQRIGRKVKELALGRQEGLQSAAHGKTDRDIRYDLSISPGEAFLGSEVSIAYKRGKKQERIGVIVPPRTKPGTILRVRGKGLEGKPGQPPGDLYLHINIDSDLDEA
ncbi:MAG: DnaJ domain-containing protein [Thermodesulfobacteriota bacterium]